MMNWKFIFISLFMGMITPTPATAVIKEYQRIALEKTNSLRARHIGVPDMILSAELCDLAERCAIWLAERRKCDHSCWFGTNKSSHWREEYKPGTGMGENCWAVGETKNGSKGYFPPENCGEAAPVSWYSEIKYWNYETNREEGGEAGHFTQMIWKTSTQLGFGVSAVEGFSCAVAKYYPPGNMVGSYKQGVMKPIMEQEARSIYDQRAPPALVVKMESTGPLKLPKSPAVLFSFALLVLFCSKLGRKTIVVLSFIMCMAILINPADATGKEYQTIGLDSHNNYRSDHETPPLTISETLNEVAEKCAVYYAVEHKTIDHSCPHKNTGMGENLYSGAGRADPDEAIAELAVKLWYEEIKDYSFSNPKKSNFHKTGHFTQLVWKESKELGFGIAFRDKRTEYIVAVAIYTPPGNVQDEHDWKYYKENVLRPVDGSHGAGLMKKDSGAAGLAKGVILLQMACLAVLI